MPVPAFRNSRSRVRRRRSHHALKQTQLGVCPKCSESILPHHACQACGFYNGKQVRGDIQEAEKTVPIKTTKTAKEAKKADE